MDSRRFAYVGLVRNTKPIVRHHLGKRSEVENLTNHKGTMAELLRGIVAKRDD